MKSYFSRVAALALVLAISLPAVAAVHRHDDGRAIDPRDRAVRVIKKILKIVKISANSDLPTPPVGSPTKP